MHEIYIWLVVFVLARLVGFENRLALNLDLKLRLIFLT